MDEIKVGDKFILTKYEYWSDKDFCTIGKEYTCKKVDSDGDVWFDTEDNPTNSDYGWYMSSDCCQKVSDV